MVRFSTLLLLLAFPFVAASDAAALGASTQTGGIAAGDGVAYFTTQFAMCRTDGTAAGTRCVPAPGDTPELPRTVLLNGKAYGMLGWPQGGQGIYEFDGEHPAREILHVSPLETAGELASNGRHLYYFSTRRIPDGLRLMRSDGTAAGTSLVRILPTLEGSMLAPAGDSILMSVKDTKWSPRHDRAALWTSDGTRDGTALLVPPPFGGAIDARVGRTSLFWSDGDLWRSDGTPSGTFVLAENMTPGPISVREPFAYFTAGQAVWRTDGTHASSFRTVSFPPYAAGIAGSRLIALERRNDTIVVWSPGSPPQQLAVIPVAGSQVPSTITHTGDLVWFTLRTAFRRVELWRSDGTPGRTSSLGAFASISHLTSLGDKVVFFADDGVYGNEPWVSDGTPEGTVMLANLAPEGVVRGIVTDAANGLPIDGALVEAGDSAVHTGPDGRYTLNGAIGRLTLWASTDRHIAVSRELTVKAHEELTADFELTQGGTITGRVTAPGGAPLSGYAVWIIPDPGLPQRVITDAEGRFRTPPIPVAPVWTVRADVQREHNAAEQTGIRLTAGETRNVELIMTPFGRLRFRMIDEVTGGPVRTNRFGVVRLYHVSGAMVAPYNPVAGSLVEIAMPDGEYNASADSAVYQPGWLGGAICGIHGCSTTPPAQRGAMIRCPGGTITTVDFVVRPQGGGVRGVLVDARTGARVSDAYVMITDPTGAYFWDRQVIDGTFDSEPIFPDRTLTVIVRPHNPAYAESRTVIEMRYAENPHPELRIELRGN